MTMTALLTNKNLFTYSEYAAPNSSSAPCVVINIEPHFPQKFVDHAKGRPVSQRVRGLELDPKKKQLLRDARKWVGESLYSHELPTLKAYRLNLGLSQTDLARLINSSQSHIARIERGTENLHIETCRKLCGALKIDMNHLNEFLFNQECELNKKNA